MLHSKVKIIKSFIIENLQLEEGLTFCVTKLQNQSNQNLLGLWLLPTFYIWNNPFNQYFVRTPFSSLPFFFSQLSSFSWASLSWNWFQIKMFSSAYSSLVLIMPSYLLFLLFFIWFQGVLSFRFPLNLWEINVKHNVYNQHSLNSPSCCTCPLEDFHYFKCLHSPPSKHFFYYYFWTDFYCTDSLCDLS